MSDSPKEFYLIQKSFILSLTYNFDLIRLTESRLKKDRRTTNIDIKGYTFEHIPTKASCGGSLLYIKDTLEYICRKDLQTYKPAELESTFIELLSSSGKNIIVCLSIDIQVCIHLNLTVFI